MQDFSLTLHKPVRSQCNQIGHKYDIVLYEGISSSGTRYSRMDQVKFVEDIL